MKHTMCGRSDGEDEEDEEESVRTRDEEESGSWETGRDSDVIVQPNNLTGVSLTSDIPIFEDIRQKRRWRRNLDLCYVFILYLRSETRLCIRGWGWY